MAEKVQSATYTRAQVCERAGLSEPTLDRLLAKKGMPPGFRVGRKRLFLREDIEQWLLWGCPDEKTFDLLKKAKKK